MFRLLAIGLILVNVAAAQIEPFTHPLKGTTSWQPASSWEHAMLSGNGTMGAMVMGQPHDETIILSHAALYLPRKRSEKLIDQASRLQEIRQLLLQGKCQQAANIPVELRWQQGYTDERDPFIPAFDVRIVQEPSNIHRYLRSVNFESGEASVDWTDDKGTFRRSTFVSRADSVIIIRIKGTAKINCSIRFARRPVEWNQWNFINEHIQGFSARAEGEWLSYQSAFKFQHPGAVHAYEGVGKVITTNGTTITSNNAIVIEDADEVMVLVKILPLYNQHHNQGLLKGQLDALEVNYSSLLNRHQQIHADLLNRVSFSLNSDSGDRRLQNEAILLKANQHVPLALIERAFDAGRYNIISSTGYNPPNLQGIWSGTWTAPWTAGMTNDGNLATAVSFLLPGNTPELTHAFFNYHERLMNDYCTAAKALYGTRGIHIPAQATTTGLDTDFNETWCLTFWTGAAGWTANFYWDYYQYTLDKDFLVKRAYTFMKEALLFYEDFLQQDNKGKYIFNPSYSPENNPANSTSQAAINATMDVMIAKQLLRNCMEAATILQTDKDKVQQWKMMLNKMPAYEVAEDGSLREWLWPDLKENHRHRHASHLYAMFDEVEEEFKNEEHLRNAAKKVIEQKIKFRIQEGGGEMAFGLVQLGSAAAHLGDAESAYQLLQWLSSKYWSSGMGSFHNVGGLFNTDISGGLPYLVSQMLAYSEKGRVKLLPALPPAWKSGEINGLLLRNNITLNLQWTEDDVVFTLLSPVAQTLKIEFPFEVQSGTKSVTAIDVLLQKNKPQIIVAHRVK